MHANTLKTPLPKGAAAFLRRYALQDAALTALVQDASPRQYYRIEDAGRLLMADPSDPAGFAAFLRVSDHLNRIGLSAPRVLHKDAANALALIEDFGDATYARCLSAGHDEEALYALAVDALLHLHHHPDGAAVDQPAFEIETQLDALSIFPEWFAPAVGPAKDAATFARDWDTLWRTALRTALSPHNTLILRDFHIDNLMLLTDRTGVARCGLLDFQDALIGPCEYDLMSLLQDARRDLAPGLEARMLARYVAAAPKRLGGAAEIAHRYAVLGAQRHGRILGVFIRLARRDSKPRYLQFLPRVVRQFDRALKDAGLSEIRALLDRHLPDWQARAMALAPA